jgi:hypothetical protein
MNDMYKLEMTMANIRHWWRGKPRYQFDTFDELIYFMVKNGLATETDIQIMRKGDEKQNARIACTSWYTVQKGEHQMTEYTSF